MSLKKRNAIFSCCINDVWIEVARELNKTHQLYPSYFVGWRNDFECEKFVKEFSESHGHYVEDAWRGEGFPKLAPEILDEVQLKLIADEVLIGLKMMDRLDPTFDAFPFTERYYWFVGLIEQWLAVIKSYNIEIVISPSIPHRVFDYALYLAAKLRNLEIVMFQMTPFADNSFIIDDVNGTCGYMKAHLSELGDVDSTDCPSEVRDRIELIKGGYDKGQPDYMVDHRRSKELRSTLWYRFVRTVEKIVKVRKVFEKSASYRRKKGYRPCEPLNNLQQQILLSKSIRYKNHLRSIYHLHQYKGELKRPYVLVALHYQPEETTCPTGGAYSEQRQIVKLLNSLLPENFIIAVKEHYSQFLDSQEGEAGRTPHYYSDLASISKRVKLISTDADPFVLIDNAEAVITVSGTIGWEAVVRGKQSLVFGRAWYEDMPGTHKVKSKKDVQAALDIILSSSSPSNMEQLDAYHKKLSKFFIKAGHYKSFREKGLSSVEESVINICDGIASHLRRNGFFK
ncbi:hypothetical protein [Pseudidiomarina gelatinasegens]|uniref:capsular polysaccharide export protein, LipB/KpsS family n=1 Tax=Pseudidiomarina gelatinasegens TaxID=2487740 RepID=UPI003A98357E